MHMDEFDYDVLVTAGIEEVVPEGVRTTDCVLHELDVLVLATGFKADSYVRPMATTGRDGFTIDQAWHDAPKARLATTVPGFRTCTSSLTVVTARELGSRMIYDPVRPPLSLG